MTIRSFRLLVAVGVVIGCLSITTVAQACGGTIGGPLVSHGWLAGHQQWFQRACLNGPRQLLVELDLPQPGGYDDGGGMGVPLPLPPTSLFIDVPYEGFGSRHADGITGVSSSNVVKLRLTFRTGAPLVVPTAPAPTPVAKRHPYLQHKRFFVAWYDGRRGAPDLVCGLTAAHRAVVCRRRVKWPAVWQPVPASP